MSYITPQESFWAGQFGNEYIERNQGSQLLASNLNFFTHCLKSAQPIDSCLEFGANIGMNLKAFKLLMPNIRLAGVEINEKAHAQLENTIGKESAHHTSIFDFKTDSKYDLTMTKGVLIHIHPDQLPLVYEKLYHHSRKYILIAEYYNPVPETILYRGESDRLFKRDFAGEFLEKFPDTHLVDYGFSYRKDPVFPQDDITWFLIEKK
ncbi:MAG: pseudaminic acid biosynthesis-associated methylase [Flavobacteriaceae bacterium]